MRQQKPDVGVRETLDPPLCADGDGAGDEYERRSSGSPANNAPPDLSAWVASIRPAGDIRAGDDFALAIVRLE